LNDGGGEEVLPVNVAVRNPERVSIVELVDEIVKINIESKIRLEKEYPSKM
jgi:hypothetical protein